MIIVTNTSKITKGDGMKLINRFDKEGKIEFMTGFLGLEVMTNEKLDEFDEVKVSTRWDSMDSFKNWMKSDAFKEAHSYNERPKYILDNKIEYYEVRVTRNPLVGSIA